MTKKELATKAKEYINRQGTIKDDWYVSDKTAASFVLENFFREELNIDLCKDGVCEDGNE